MPCLHQQNSRPQSGQLWAVVVAVPPKLLAASAAGFVVGQRVTNIPAICCPCLLPNSCPARLARYHNVLLHVVYIWEACTLSTAHRAKQVQAIRLAMTTSFTQADACVQARKNLEYVRGRKDVDREYNDLVEAAKLAAECKHPWKTLFSKKYRPQLILSACSTTFQQWTG